MLSHGDLDVNERQYFKSLPTRAELESLARLLPGGVRDLLSVRSSRVRELGLDPKTLSDDAIYDLLTHEPKLLKRPILTDGQRVIVGLDREAISAFVTEKS